MWSKNTVVTIIPVRSPGSFVGHRWSIGIGLLEMYIYRCICISYLVGIVSGEWRVLNIIYM